MKGKEKISKGQIDLLAKAYQYILSGQWGIQKETINPISEKDDGQLDENPDD